MAVYNGPAVLVPLLYVNTITKSKLLHTVSLPAHKGMTLPKPSNFACLA